MGRRQIFVACVTAQKSCDRLIRSAKAISDNHKAKLAVVSVINTSAENSKFEEQINTLDYLRSVCSELDVEFTLLYSENPVQAVAKYIKHRHASCLFTGEPGAGSNSFVNLINAVLPKVEVTVLPKIHISAEQSMFRLRPGISASGI